ncbi:glycosyltransferase [Gordonia jacobaea]|uniref:glycosyltransferase n=1 Tax=Gordonia jacobaea TaxID=122202 RepID=UPI003D716BB5
MLGKILELRFLRLNQSSNTKLGTVSTPRLGNGSIRVLHVVDCASGVAAAIRSYTESTPEIVHQIYFMRRRDVASSTGYIDMPEGVRVVENERVLWKEFGRIRKLVQEYRPDVVHCHSSWAGGVTRLSIVRSRHRRILYSPHCFAFERGDLSKPTRRLVRVFELALSLNTSRYVCCSTREQRLARRLKFGRSGSSYVANCPDRRFIFNLPLGHVRSTGEPVRVIGVGRVSSQKAPNWFADVARRVKGLGEAVPIEFIWVGGGDPVLESSLRDAGVIVTGWLDEEGVAKSMAEADIYLHSAAWEGFPVALLNAVAMGLCPIVRDIPAMHGFEAMCARSPYSAAVQIMEALKRPEYASERLMDWRALLADNRREVQRRQLLAAYGLEYA